MINIRKKENTLGPEVGINSFLYFTLNRWVFQFMTALDIQHRWDTEQWKALNAIGNRRKRSKCLGNINNHTDSMFLFYIKTHGCILGPMSKSYPWGEEGHEKKFVCSVGKHALRTGYIEQIWKKILGSLTPWK